MFKVGQKVWCAIYGAGIVVEVQHASGGAYPVEVRFNNGRICIYTSDGKYCADSSIVLFPYPIEITKTAVKPSIGVEPLRKQVVPETLVVPDGYALMPIEPTTGICKAAADGWLDCGSKMVLNKAGAAYRSSVAYFMKKGTQS